MRPSFAIILLFSVFHLTAQGQAAESLEPDPVEAANINWPLDSLLPAFRFHKAEFSPELMARYNELNYPPDSIPAIPKDSTMKWLYELKSPIPLDYNEYVQSYINMYVNKRRGQVSRMLGLQEIYFPIFEEECDRQGVPMELKYLPIVESALNPHARSRVGATGLWQFMLATGKLYGLKVDSYKDERQDPYKSSEAAVRYLRNMYKTYGDWLLVIAAYNCGPGNVNKAIRRSGGHRNFWAIREYLPRETRGYVPAFIAATYVMNYAPEHNIRPTLIDFSFNVDTLHLRHKNMTLDHIATYTQTDIYTLKDLNPELKSHGIPFESSPYPLRVPFRTAEIWAANQDSIYKLIAINDSIQAAIDSARISPITRTNYAANSGNPGSSNSGGSAPSGTVLVYHRVKSGEVVGKIAERYHVSAAQVANWNDLYRYRIKVGQKLKIYVPEKYANRPDPQPVKVEAKQEVQKIPGKKYHTVKSGDTLWDIAALYEGVTVEKLMNLNNLSNSSLKVGQHLRLE